MSIVYDIETYPNCFLICFHRLLDGSKKTFEISSRRNDLKQLGSWLCDMHNHGHEMIGFNNIGFDYPVLHAVLAGGWNDPKMIYEKAMAIINSEDRFTHLVKPSNWWLPQIDLFKIHHFDNKARSASLKSLEFNLQLGDIRGLPFPAGTLLTHDQMDVLKSYCFNDINATVAFYEKTKEQIAFRRELTRKYKTDFMNFSDVKIGKEIFRITLEAAGVQCYDYDYNTGRQPRQTLRTSIALKECVPPYVSFRKPEFVKVVHTIMAKTIYVTKGAFDDLTATVDGLEFVFGTGGLHASVENMSYISDDEWMIYDVDVTSLYPSIAIENGYYPEHLGEKFVEVYRQLREDRVSFPKGTPENAMLKLALNGVYGASNDSYSIFYDSLFTMKITITGQLVMAMLSERLLTVPGVKIIQVNTDGVTLYMPRRIKSAVDAVCTQWEKLTGLSLEHAEFARMYIADVNNYVAQKTDGTVKRKGRYEYKTEWHQNASALVVPKVAEKVLLEKVPIRETVEQWPDFLDFMLRAKIPKGSHLIADPFWESPRLENLQRYYICKDGVELFKIMPPLANKPDVERCIAVQKGWKVCPCNCILDAVKPIDYDWYINEVEKLVLELI